MNKLNSWLFVGVMVVITMASISAEIHRARNAPTYQYRIRKPHAGQSTRRTDPESERSDSEAPVFDSWNAWLDVKVWGHSRKVWVLSAISSGMVGVTGIIPLLVIPANCGFDINSQVSSNRMKGLLSFAVGGLLGDVFLHLLPEAWSHVSDYEDRLSGYRSIGLWFLGGLLSFYFVEKLFGGDEEEEEEDEEKEESEKVVEGEGEKMRESLEDSSDSDEKMRFSKLIMREREGDTLSPSNKNKDLRNRKVTKNNKNGGDDIINNTEEDDETTPKMAMNSMSPISTTTKSPTTTVVASCNGEVVMHDDDDDDDGEGEDVGEGGKVKKATEKIKVSGWLNLLANIVDNFTHGLAVAGSYCISPKMGLLTTFAILLHEIPHEIGDFAILLRAGFDRWKAAKAQLMTASGGIIGAMIALSAESVKIAGDSTAWILPFTAGGFVNIAMVTIVPDLVKEKFTGQSMKQLSLVTAGILVMGLVTVLVE